MGRRNAAYNLERTQAIIDLGLVLSVFELNFDRTERLPTYTPMSTGPNICTPTPTPALIARTVAVVDIGATSVRMAIAEIDSAPSERSRADSRRSFPGRVPGKRYLYQPTNSPPKYRRMCRCAEKLPSSHARVRNFRYRSCSSRCNQCCSRS